MAQRATTNLFDTASVVSGKPAKPAKGKADDKTEVAGLEELGAFRAVQKTLKAVESLSKDAVQQELADMFLEDGFRLKNKPENFKGVEGDCDASCQLKKRSTTSPLSEVEQGLFNVYKIPYAEKRDVIDTFIIDPIEAKKPEVQKAISDALAPLIKKGVVSEGVIKRQVSNVTYVTTDDTIPAVFALAGQEQKKIGDGKLPPKEVIKLLLPVAANITPSCKWRGKMETAVQRVFKAVLNRAKKIDSGEIVEGEDD